VFPSIIGKSFPINTSLFFETFVKNLYYRCQPKKNYPTGRSLGLLLSQSLQIDDKKLEEHEETA